MAYQQLNVSTSPTWQDRMNFIEADLAFKETVGLYGQHFYAAGYIPLAATSGTDAASSTVIYVSELRVSSNTLITGLAYLVGSVGSTGNVIVILYDANGNVVANSALAGTPIGSAAGFQAVPFTTPALGFVQVTS